MTHVYVLESCMNADDHSGIDGVFTTPEKAMEHAAESAGHRLDWSGEPITEGLRWGTAHVIRECTDDYGEVHRFVDAYYITRYELDPTEDD